MSRRKTPSTAAVQTCENPERKVVSMQGREIKIVGFSPGKTKLAELIQFHGQTVSRIIHLYNGNPDP